MKNWLPPVSLPACAMESVPATCLCVFFCVSHLIVYPGPPVPTGPLPVLEYGSPPWIMKFGITRWNFVASRQVVNDLHGVRHGCLDRRHAFFRRVHRDAIEPLPRQPWWR